MIAVGLGHSTALDWKGEYPFAVCLRALPDGTLTLKTYSVMRIRGVNRAFQNLFRVFPFVCS